MEKIKESLIYLGKNRGWESIKSPFKKVDIKELLKNKETFSHDFFYPLIISLKSNETNLIEKSLQALCEAYCQKLLDFIIPETNTHILIEIGKIFSEFSPKIYKNAKLQIVRFSLGVISGETSIESPVHNETLLNYFQALFECTVTSTNHTEDSASKAAIFQAIISIANRFEKPPIYDTDEKLIGFSVAKTIVFRSMLSELFEILDNQSFIPEPYNVYESDGLLLLRTICTNTLSDNKNPEFSTLLSIQLIISFLNCDKEIIHTSFGYLKIIRNLICSIILILSKTTSYSVFTSTLHLCRLTMTKYREMLKAETSVFFSTLFFGIIDGDSPEFFKLSVIEQIGKFSAPYLAQLFVNFDCDLDLQEANIFERMIKSLMNSPNKIESIKALSIILEKLNKWSSNQHPNSQTVLPFEKTHKLKIKYSKAIDEFNSDPEHNLKSLIKSGLVKEDPKSIATFFHTHRNLLSYSGVGLILGSSNSFYKEIMHEYIDIIDFSNKSLCEALYYFLSLFKLPPESQQIDRIIEKFAHSYYLTHKSEYPSASSVYDASFAIVILHTDAHNPQVIHKMQKNEFLKLYRDMDEGDALPVEFIESIYDYVVSHEIKLINSTDVISIQEDFRSQTQKGLESYKKSIDYIKEAQKQMRNSKHSEIRWISNINSDLVRPIFEMIWMPLNALASNNLNEDCSEELIESSLKILTSSIGISARFYMEIESTYCMSALCSFAKLQPWTTIRYQNLKAIRELLDMSKTFSSYYEPVWEKLITLFAQINYLMLIHNTTNLNNEIVNNNAKLIVTYIPLTEVDSLFEASSNFPSVAIISFVNALCKVSNNELAQHPPRTFCLQKIVEVTSFNMERVRFVWTQIWKPISNHLIEAGCFPNESIACTAVDSLRQLAGRFLSREEFQSFHYQKDFLKPFHSILRKSKSKNIRLHVLRSLNYTINKYHSKMKSGWEATFSMLESAATIKEVNRLALTVLIDILELHLNEIINEKFIKNVFNTIDKFLLIGKNITLSTVYIIVGIYEQMMKLNSGFNDFKYLLNCICGIIKNKIYANILLKKMKKITKNLYWKVISNDFLIKIIDENKNDENWLNEIGYKFVKLIIPNCCEQCINDGISLILKCSNVLNHKILNICVINIKKFRNDENKNIFIDVISNLLNSISINIKNNEKIDLMSELIIDLIDCFQPNDLKLISNSLKSKINQSILVIKTLLIISKKELSLNIIDINEFKKICVNLFEESDEGKVAVIDEVTKLDDKQFVEIAPSLAVNAAKDISCGEKKLSNALAAFFLRMSQKCFSENIVE